MSHLAGGMGRISGSSKIRLIVYGTNPRHSSIPAATIYITSRPWATGGLLQQLGDRISQHTELLALAKEEVENQMRAIAVAEGTVERSSFNFMAYIDSNPVMCAAMYTPVTAAIVGQVFKSAPHSPPTTVTQLYSAYVLMRLERYLAQHPKYSDRNMKVRTLSDLPEGVSADFWRLCALAYEGVSQHMIVFSNLPEGVSTLGLMQCVPQLYWEGVDKVSYNFLHYTVQEYLAALHLSHLPPQEQMTIIDTKCLRVVKTEYGEFHNETTHFKTTFQFLAGITKLVSYPADFLSKLLSRSAVTTYSWLYESQNLPLLTSVLGSDERELSLPYSATTTDYFVAGYCLAHSNFTWSVKFDWISVDDVAMEFLSKGCNHHLPETGIPSRIVKASFIDGSITADGVGHFLTVPTSLLQHNRELILTANKLDRRARMLKRNNSLEKLDLSWGSIGSSGGVELGAALESNKTLKVLDLSGNALGDSGARGMYAGLENNSTLEVLYLNGDKSLGEEEVSLLLKCVKEKNKNLKRLWLSKNKYKRNISSALQSRCEVKLW